MHTLSLPPADRDELPAAETTETALTGDTLREAVKATGLSNSEISRATRISDTGVSQWRNNKYPGDNARLEAKIRAWLRDRTMAVQSGVVTIKTKLSDAICKRLAAIRDTRELAVITGEAGIGKTRSQNLFLQTDPRAVGFRSLPWRSSMGALADDFCVAVEINRLPRGVRRWDHIIERTKGGGWLLIIDDAHELGPRSLQCCVDWHEETGNPLALFGLPSLKNIILRDTRRARRVGDLWELPFSDPKPLIDHMIDQLSDVPPGERAKLYSLAAQVAAREGHFGSLEKQLQKAARIHASKKVSWPEAFTESQKYLMRLYTLDQHSELARN